MRLPDDVLGSGDPIVSWLPGVRLTGAAFVSFRFGSWAAVRHNARIRQHCLSKQTLCRRDSGSLERQLPTFAIHPYDDNSKKRTR